MQTDKKVHLNILICILLAAISLNIFIPTVVFASSSNVLEITGDGVSNPMIFTREQLKEMEQYQETYSCINTWPTKKWYVGKGVKLWDLLLKAGIKKDAKLFKFTSKDGYTTLLTFKELFEDERYCFPNFKTSEDGGHLPGSPRDAVKVESLVGLVSVEDSDEPKYMSDMHTLMLMVGQRSVTEQTGNLFVKYLNKIEVSTDEPEKWDAPKANPEDGLVPKGTMVTLNNLNNDDDKIYYTIDGSTPTLNSPMYNKIASRWWSVRGDVLGNINRPIGPVDENITIKAVTIGPGKIDSDVATFSYYVDGSEIFDDAGIRENAHESAKTEKIIKLTVGQPTVLVNGKALILDVAPYLNVEAGRTLIPVRFISETLGAQVKWNQETWQVTIISREKEIILTIGSKDVLIGGERHTIDCEAVIQSGYTFVPLRFVSEHLGAQVEYMDGTKEIIIKK